MSPSTLQQHQLPKVAPIKGLGLRVEGLEFGVSRVRPSEITFLLPNSRIKRRMQSHSISNPFIGAKGWVDGICALVIIANVF